VTIARSWRRIGFGVDWNRVRDVLGRVKATHFEMRDGIDQLSVNIISRTSIRGLGVHDAARHS
jgi:hypothetical protein